MLLSKNQIMFVLCADGESCILVKYLGIGFQITQMSNNGYHFSSVISKITIKMHYLKNYITLHTIRFAYKKL